ncbi:MAG: VPLPA-CTERM sorting domain-containing protein [Paracoccaceae bacterium]
MFLTSNSGRSFAAATIFTALAATSAFAAPISVTLFGTTSYGSHYDYNTGVSTDLPGYAIEVTISGDDTDLPVSSESSSYAGHFSYDYTTLNVNYDIAVYDTLGTLVDSTSISDQSLTLYNYSSDSQSGYWDQAYGYASVYDNATYASSDFYLSFYGNGPTSLFPTDGAITSLSALASIASNAIHGSYNFFSSYNSEESVYYDFDLDSVGPTISSGSNTQPNAVPLPAGGLLLLSGFGALAVTRRRKS